MLKNPSKRACGTGRHDRLCGDLPKVRTMVRELSRVSQPVRLRDVLQTMANPEQYTTALRATKTYGCVD